MESRKGRGRGKKKRRFLKWFLLVFFILVAAAAAYSIVQYYQGLSEASDGKYRDDGETFGKFNGKEPQFGEITTLLIGNDAREGEHGRSDTLMIGYYNQKTKQTKLVSIMRDVYVDVPGHGKQKINAAFSMGGPELLRQTIKENFDIDINYYAVVDFNGFPKLIDLLAPNGIEVDIPEKMSYGIGMTLHPGKQVLHGKEILGYVRFRHDRQSDFGRVERQQEVLSKVKDEAVQVQNVMKLPKLLGMTDPYVDTNLGNGTIFTIGKGLISGGTSGMETLRIPVEGSFHDERNEAGAVLSIDLDANRQALKQFLSDGSK